MKKKWKSLKPLTAVFCAAALTLGLAACSGGNTSADTGSASDTESASSAGQEAAGSGSASGRTDLNLRISDAFSTVDPHNLSLNSDIMLSRQVYEPLYWINDEGEEIPMLATEYSVSEDGLTWTFQLREGVTFQNGDPLTAQDVVYSYERCFDNAYMQEKVEAIDSVTAPDDSTVEMHLKYQFSPLMEKIAAIGIVSQSFAEANMDDQGLLGFNACGTGAYSVKEAIPDVSITLEAYSGYWGGEAPIKTLNFEQITDETTAVTAFEAGEIDVMSIPSANWAQISESGQYNTDSRPSNHVVYLIFNTEAAPFDNRELRQASGNRRPDTGTVRLCSALQSADHHSLEQGSELHAFRNGRALQGLQLELSPGSIKRLAWRKRLKNALDSAFFNQDLSRSVTNPE